MPICMTAWIYAIIYGMISFFRFWECTHAQDLCVWLLLKSVTLPGGHLLFVKLNSRQTFKSSSDFLNWKQFIPIQPIHSTLSSVYKKKQKTTSWWHQLCWICKVVSSSIYTKMATWGLRSRKCSLLWEDYKFCNKGAFLLGLAIYPVNILESEFICWLLERFFGCDPKLTQFSFVTRAFIIT